MADRDNFRSLTREEATVLWGRCHNVTDEEIGKQLFVAQDRVAQHMTGVYRKLGYPREMHATLKKRLLEEEYCPLLPETLEQLMAMNPANAGKIPPTPPPVRPKPTGNATSVLGVLAAFIGALFGILILGGAAYWFLLRPSTAAPNPTSVVIPQPSPIGHMPVSPQASEVPSQTAQATLLPPTEAPTALSTPSPTALFVPPADGILFQDNFDSGIDTSLWQPVNGQWITSNGRLSIAFTETGTQWISVGNQNWKNYRVDLNIHRLTGVTFIGVRDMEHLYVVGFVGRSCWTDQGDPNYNCITDEVDSPGVDFNLEIEVNGSNYIARVGAVEVQRISMAGKASGAVSIGIWCSEGFSCPSIDNFKVTYLP